ncbi:hypothetical protein H9P43_000169 [Blastocladiella emersonii ATCC 22665]|nr:hypothetical protein H9P43_000169 [Blastocladiella emersonii ATCC 22665]
MIHAPALLAIIALASLTTSVHAWGNEGHEAVGTIAYKFLQPKTKTTVDQLLKIGNYSSIEQAATWPDWYRGTGGHPETTAHHFINAQDEPTAHPQMCGLVYPKDCTSASCVVEQIAVSAGHLAKYRRRPVYGRKNATADLEAGMALSFLTHYVGDIAQPLHASGFLKGGNGVNVTFAGKTVNMHKAWDSTILQKTIATEFAGDKAQWVDNLIASADPDGATYVRCAEKVDGTDFAAAEACAVKWAQESVKLVCTAVFPEDYYKENMEIANEYFAFARRIVDNQVLTAGLRLAAVLNTIFA